MPGEPGRAECGRFENSRPVNGGAQDIGEALHGPVARYHTAIDTQHRLAAACPVAAHRFDEVERLERDGFKRRAGHFLRPGGSRQPENRAARFRVPVRCAETSEGRDENHVLQRIGLGRQHPRVLGALDQLQPVAEPLYGRAGDEDRTLQRVGRAAVETVGDRGQELVVRRDRLSAGVQDGEAARAVCGFHHAWLETGLPHRRRLLVAGDPTDGDRRAEQRRLGRTEIAGAVAHLRQHRSRHAEQP